MRINLIRILNTDFYTEDGAAGLLLFQVLPIIPTFEFQLTFFYLSVTHFCSCNCLNLNPQQELEWQNWGTRKAWVVRKAKRLRIEQCRYTVKYRYITGKEYVLQGTGTYFFCTYPVPVVSLNSTVHKQQISIVGHS